MARLRNDPRTREIPVVFVTAMDSTEAEERGLDCGAVDYIKTPAARRLSLARVRYQLELSRRAIAARSKVTT